ncbi:hypothetical protein [Bacillus sp. X1(2014)]|uniref:hypothetical protein n=1 Tax=Bacillus sp. X1(2014) TaxID=1565991 RepID=UPI00119D1BF9|nr:hypothetical protein [Bacillus sp. X1(2014)]
MTVFGIIAVFGTDLIIKISEGIIVRTRLLLKLRKLSEDDRSSDTIAIEITKAVRSRPKFDTIAIEITKAVRSRPKFGHDCH